ncbi:MAG: hypothetical protein XU15_C0004G0147 [candidate division NC10 bacterium CSP1-5]|nr:MAG: hypothetical protein XU15_C0004G0147 [candidate division NC10 bacterium CSP1-5]
MDINLQHENVAWGRWGEVSFPIAFPLDDTTDYSRGVSPVKAKPPNPATAEYLHGLLKKTMGRRRIRFSEELGGIGRESPRPGPSR